MRVTFIQKIRLDGFESFAPGSDALEFQPLNVLIDANASGCPELGADESSDVFGRVINEMARQRKDDEPGN